jgi:toxin lethal factor
MPPVPDAAALAAKIVVAGGSGNADDVAAVRPEIAKLSAELLNLFVAKGARVVACRGSVTDVETKLRGKVPRGWEGVGRTWDSVPGTYLTKGKRVLVATAAAPGGGREVPGTGASHGSSNLALHETLHGHHYLTSHTVLKAQRFIQARTADFGRLPDYLKQAKRPGLEETYAESGARFFQRDTGLAAEWPALFAYWSGAPIPPPPAGDVSDVEEAPDEPSIGSAEMADDGTITLDLRAGARGMVGHALFVLRPGDPEYERVRAHSFSMENDAMPADSGPARVSVRPFGPS